VIDLKSGDCLEILPTLTENSLDACVTDPPYHLTSQVATTRSAFPGRYAGTKGAAVGFMGKQWDGGDIAFRPETWAEVYRVLKPGAHLLAFGGTRTYHRMACAIEDAGFEIRDTIMWVYGSGFPKSHDVSKGIDRAAGAERQVVGKYVSPENTSGGKGRRFCHDPTRELNGLPDITAPATDAARQWQGWGTALKPACEPIVLARKPLSEKTVAANVLKWGTGALNIDGARIPASDERSGGFGNGKRPWQTGDVGGNTTYVGSEVGRWPANILHDGSEEVVDGFPDTQSGILRGSSIKAPNQIYGSRPKKLDGEWDYGDSGSAARFFYCAKASKAERNGSKHPTVKPLKLMQYLIRLVTPKGGTILDPFAGSGTTGQAALNEGCHAILIEREPEYQIDIQRRLESGLIPLITGNMI